MPTKPPLLSGPALAKAVSETYTHAYPLVLMGITRSVSTNVASPHDAMGKAPVNQLTDARTLIPASTGLALHLDSTLHSLAWLDLAEQPLVLSVGKALGGDCPPPILDAWTNAVARAPGDRKPGDDGGRYALCGPGWSGALPDGLTRIDIPTAMAWIVGGIEYHGKIQNGLSLVPLSDWTGDPASYTPPLGLIDRGIDMIHSPPDQIIALTNGDCGQFFTKFCGLMAANPPNPANPAMEELLRALGLVPGADIHWAQTMSTADFTITQAAATQALNAIQNPPTPTMRRRSVDKVLDSAWKPLALVPMS